MTVDTAEFGPVTVYGKKTVAQHFAVLFSPETGISTADHLAVDRLVEQGMTVAVIDTRQALETLKRFDKSCLYLPGPLEWISHMAERQLGFPDYSEPLLLGSGAGGLMVYVALVQAPPLSFPGGMSADLPAPQLNFAKRFCNLDQDLQHDGKLNVAAGYRLQGWWRVGGSASLNEAANEFVHSVSLANGDKVKLIPQAFALPNLYADTTKVVLRELTPSEKEQTLDDLPLIEVSAQSSIKTLAIIYSGDGGWRDLDRSLGDLLKAKGFAVLGVDALRYFWTMRTPEATAGDLTRIVKHYRQSWKLDNVVLIGFSFGADILPFAYNGLPAELKASVRMISLLVPSLKADFKIQMSGWFGGGSSPEALAIEPEIRKIEPSKLQCFYGAEEVSESLCLTSAMAKSERIERPGGHHFDLNYQTIADRIEAGLLGHRKESVAK